MHSIITPKEIIESRNKHDKNICLLKLSLNNVRNSSNTKYPTSYIPITFTNVDGKDVPINIKFNNQIISSRAKPPASVSIEDAKDVRIVHRKITDADLDNSDYPRNKHDELLRLNSEFIESLNIIADEYIRAVEELLENKQKQVKLNKNKTVNCFRQTHRNASESEILEDLKRDNDNKIVDDNQQIELEHPLFRFKLEADFRTKKIGRNMYGLKTIEAEKNNKFMYTVFDARKSNKSSDYKAVPAKIITSSIVKGKKVNVPKDLTIMNAGKFITNLSLTGGKIIFDSVCVSKSGISLMNKYNELHVWPHKVITMKVMNEDDMHGMSMLGTDGYVDEVVDEDEPNNNNSKKNISNKSDNDEQFLDEPADDSEHADDSEPDDNQDNVDN